MRKFIFLFFLIIPIGIQAQPLTVAILDFENISTDDKYDGLGKALSNMLISDLSQNIDRSKINFLERSQLNKLLEEQVLQKSESFDQNTAVSIGRLIGVDYVILGSVFILDQTSSFSSRMVNVETSEILFSEETSGNISNWLSIKSNLAEKLSSSLNSPITIPKSQSEQAITEEVLTTYASAIESLDNEDSAEAENLLNELKKLQSDFAYVDGLSNDILALQRQVESNTQRIEEISRSGGLILNPETLADYRNNLMSDRLSFEDRRSRRREMISKFEVTYNDLFINETFSVVTAEVNEQEFRKDLEFIQALNDVQKQLTFIRRLIDDVLMSDATNRQWNNVKINRYDELWRQFYFIFSSLNQEPEAITEDEFAFIMLFEQRFQVSGNPYVNYLTSSVEKILMNMDANLDTRKLSEKLRAAFTDVQLASQKFEIIDLIDRALSKQIINTCEDKRLDCSSIGTVQSNLLNNAYVYNQPTLVPQFIQKFKNSFSSLNDELNFDEKTYLDLINKYELSAGIADGEDRDRLYLESVQDKNSKIDYINSTFQEMEKELSINGWKRNDFERYVRLLEAKYTINSASIDDEILDLDEYILIGLMELAGRSFPDVPMSNKDILDISIYTDLLQTYYDKTLYNKVENIDHEYVKESINRINKLDKFYTDIPRDDNFDIIFEVLSKKLYSKCISKNLNCVKKHQLYSVYLLNSVNLNDRNDGITGMSLTMAVHIYDSNERQYRILAYDNIGYTIKFESSIWSDHFVNGFHVENSQLDDEQAFNNFLIKYASSTIPKFEAIIRNLQNIIAFNKLIQVIQRDRSESTVEELFKGQLDIPFEDFVEAYHELSEDLNSNNSGQYIDRLVGINILDFDFTINSSWERRSSWINKMFNELGGPTFDLATYMQRFNGAENFWDIPLEKIILTDLLPTGTLVEVANLETYSPSNYPSNSYYYYFVLNSDGSSLGSKAYFIKNSNLNTERLKVFEIPNIHNYISKELISNLNLNYQSFIDQWKEASQSFIDQRNEAEAKKLEEYRILKERYRENISFLSDNIEFEIVKDWFNQLLLKDNEDHFNYTTKRLFQEYINWGDAFNHCFARYSDPQATEAELEKVLTLNVYLDVFFYEEEFAEQLEQVEDSGARLKDLEIANRLNLVTGFIRYAERYNSDMLPGLISLYTSFDLNYKFNSGWDDMTVRDMIEIDITEMVKNGLISPKVEAQVKSIL